MKHEKNRFLFFFGFTSFSTFNFQFHFIYNQMNIKKSVIEFKGMLQHLSKARPGADEFLTIISETKRWLSLPQAVQVRATATFSDPHQLVLIECGILWRTIERWNFSRSKLDGFTEVFSCKGLWEKFAEPWSIILFIFGCFNFCFSLLFFINIIFV